MNGVDTTARRWLRCYRPRPAATVRLVCFPHATGSAPFYRSWARELPDGVELLAVQYPGRLDRIGEPPLTAMALLADMITEVLAPRRDLPVALFGHSMGAAVAYEVARRLERRQGGPLAHLFVSGRPAPCHHRPGIKHLGPDDVLWAELRRLGGTDPAALDNPQLRAAVLPTLRADYQLIESYRPVAGDQLVTPISALVGDVDTEAAVDEVAAWAGYTRAAFDLTVFDGDHFYLVPHRTKVLAGVIRSLGLP
ncbi:pyochelin biosynthetic protein PchC [Micromonospora phaseoli]|uniref:Pyochelin biosynthetic protein PchC n=1 Tax=Micromonospora phaseoli TaxID=1144548 RepID=A0A1H6YAG1_9ACTN|nr:alpha/beta fold hydrolase [Micromonospora phaseoli]PZW00107.1 pyochelin biosynthetic protein PchC [Micromonospora phaseoli]GIJ79617.1 thioesterase [Micromonospora phaseoli]SEJ38293.1 pyochelin biosynthetic protein PchC [Micromonospora phaseoli]